MAEEKAPPVVIDDRAPPKPTRSGAPTPARSAPVPSGKASHPRLGAAVASCPECGLPVFAGADSGHAYRHAPEEDPHRTVKPELEIWDEVRALTPAGKKES